MKIGFIGIGVMGSPMTLNLINAGHDLAVYTRTESKASAVTEKGAVWRSSVAGCVADRDAVITMVGYPKDVEEVYFGDKGIIANSKPGTIIVDMTTTSPRLAERIFAEAKAKGIKALDAPVSGGDSGAKGGTLSIMVGGDKEAFDTFLPVFQAMGKNIVYQGGAGKGQHTKFCNQLALAGTLAGVCEAISYARATGLDPETVLQSIGSGAAGSWQMTNNAPKILKGDYAPGFYVKHFIKDMIIAQEEAAEAGLRLPVLTATLGMYKKLEDAGLGDLGTQALIRYFTDKMF